MPFFYFFREYDRFRHCIGDVVTKQCDEEDESSMGNYLLDSAGEMIWTCPHQAGSQKSPIVDEGFVGVAKPSVNVKKVATLDPLERLDPLDQHVPPLDQHVPPLDQHVSPLTIAKKPIGISGGKIDVEESHLNGVFSAPLTGNSPYVTGEDEALC